jgi:hypothetical protein
VAQLRFNVVESHAQQFQSSNNINANSAKAGSGKLADLLVWIAGILLLANPG